MKLKNIFRMFDPLPTIIILAVALPFLIIGLGEVHKAQVMVKEFTTASGTVIDNQYQISTDPEDSSIVYRTYHPVIRFTSERGKQFIFTDKTGSQPPAYEIGDVVEVLYNPEDPQEATLRTWWSIWMGPVLFTFIGLLPILGLVGWAVWRYVRAERRFQAARQAQLR